jgi:5-methylcytosine-specific restriction protein A
MIFPSKLRNEEMRFWDIDSKEAILAAVYEFDRLGKERFLEKHGYGDAVSYFLVVNGKRYPSEAIVGVAHGYQFPDEGPLQSSDFSGGRETVQKKLEDLGFEVFVEHGLSVEEGPDFIHNNIYRRIDIHNQFGGQRQGGISTPSNRNFVFLFTGEAGQQYGYSDGWTDDGSFFYTGEGQEGDMEFVRGNLAIRDHLDDGKDLYLFQYADRGSVRFLGKFICTGHHFREGPMLGATFAE